MFSWLLPRHVPLIVAHRGSSLLAPENTLAAFQQAVDDGADAVELDVHLTADHEVVVLHDVSLRRTTNGMGNVERCTLEAIRRLSAGAWFHQGFASERIPTLHQVFDLIRGRIGINIELKSRNRRRGKILVDRCLEIIDEHHAESLTLLTSFHHHLIRRAKQICPEVAGGLLFQPLQHLRHSPRSLAKKDPVDYVMFSSALIRKREVRKLHTYAMFAGEFAVNTDRHFRRACRYGVDAVITNDPSRMIALRSLVEKIKKPH